MREEDIVTNPYIYFEVHIPSVGYWSMYRRVETLDEAAAYMDSLVYEVWMEQGGTKTFEEFYCTVNAEYMFTREDEYVDFILTCGKDKVFRELIDWDNSIGVDFVYDISIY